MFFISVGKDGSIKSWDDDGFGVNVGLKETRHFKGRDLREVCVYI